MERDYLRVGKISSINYKSGTARITYEDKGGSTTAEMPFLALAWQYWMPRVGDQVLVAHLSNGTSSAVILGAVWHSGHRPFEGAEGLYRRDYCNDPGKAAERYDEKAEDYSQRITGDMEIGATESWTVKVGESTLLKIDKSGAVTVIAPAKITVSATGGITVSAQGGVTIDTPTLQVTGDVISGNISLQKHIHAGVHGDTGPAK